MIRQLGAVGLILGLVACSTPAITPGLDTATVQPLASSTATQAVPTQAPHPTATQFPSITPTAPVTSSPTSAPTPTPTPVSPIPDFSHVIVFIFENKEFGTVIGSSAMPNYNRYAQEYALLSQYYAIRHPSLPNYLALVGGDTFGIDRNCESCYIQAANLADLIEASGRTWKTYQEDMPEACFLGSSLDYAQKHNPFIYFDSIRLNPERCQRSVVPLSELDVDLANNTLPDYAFITPNLCNSTHDCPLNTADIWLEGWMQRLMASPGYDERTLIVLTWDEGQGDHTCCGLPEGGGRVATVLVSPLVQRGYVDETPYTHYSLLKTISTAWGLDMLAHAADPENALIAAPFEK